MGERVLDSEAVSAGDAGPAIGHPLPRTDLVMYAGASGDLNPLPGETKIEGVAVAVLP